MTYICINIYTDKSVDKLSSFTTYVSMRIVFKYFLFFERLKFGKLSTRYGYSKPLSIFCISQFILY
jgi:hypothetical protein